MKQLSSSEISTVIQARILGIETMQLPAVERLQKLAVPEHLIKAASGAMTQEELDAAENAIIALAKDRWCLDEVDALLVLNGKAQPVQQA